MSEPSIEEALEEAFDNDASEEQGELDLGDDDTTEVADAEDDQEPADDSEEPEASDGEDDSEAVDDDEADGEESDADGDEGEETPAAASGDTADEDDGDSGRAPVSWKPEARESWKELPAEVKAEVMRREQEVQQALGQSTGARRFAQEWSEMVRPYEPLMAAQGATAQQGVQRLLEIGAGLSMGNATQKADIVKNLIQQYQIDLPTLDAMLAGSHQEDPSQQIEQIVQQRLAPIQQQLMQRQQEEEQRAQEGLQSELSEFRKDAEFFDDVRADMADMLEVAARNGRPMNLKDAYDRACALNPSISKVLDQRRKVASVKNGKKTALKKRTAASSVRGKAAGTGATSDPNSSIDAALAAAFDKVENRKRNRV